MAGGGARGDVLVRFVPFRCDAAGDGYSESPLERWVPGLEGDGDICDTA